MRQGQSVAEDTTGNGAHGGRSCKVREVHSHRRPVCGPRHLPTAPRTACRATRAGVSCRCCWSQGVCPGGIHLAQGLAALAGVDGFQQRDAVVVPEDVVDRVGHEVARHLQLLGVAGVCGGGRTRSSSNGSCGWLAAAAAGRGCGCCCRSCDSGNAFACQQFGEVHLDVVAGHKGRQIPCRCDARPPAPARASPEGVRPSARDWISCWPWAVLA